ncbi:MAG: extracellular solute-binding protein [Bacteroidota bacterium]
MRNSRGMVRVLLISVALMTVITLLVPVLTAEKGYPVAGNPELSIWFPLPGGSVFKNFSEVLCFKEASKRTGIKINWTNPTTGLDNEQFSLMLASRKLPDMLTLPSGLGGWNSGGNAEKFYKDGIIIKLNDLIDKYAPNLKALLNKNAELRKQLMADDGSIYYVPQMRLRPEIRVYAGFFIRRDWMNKLGLKDPKTPDEWYNVLKAFKTRDPNGNGKADEIPFGGSKHPGGGPFEMMKLPWMFGANIGSSWNNGLQQQNGKVVFSPITPEYKAALTWINKLYAEGLIDPDFAITDRNGFQAKVLADRVGATFGNAGSGITYFMTNMVGKEPKSFRMEGVPYPKAPGSKPYSFDNSVINLATGSGLAITTACKNPIAAIKFLDYGFSKEGHMLFNFGVEGLTYKMVKGYPTYTEMITKNRQGLNITQALGLYVYGTNWMTDQDGRYFEQYQKIPVPGVQGTPAWDAIQIWTKSMDTSRILPSVNPRPEEVQAISAKLTEISTYVLEMYYKFIMGTAKLSEFDAYVAQVKKMGIDDVVKVYQAALDRYNKRK